MTDSFPARPLRAVPNSGAQPAARGSRLPPHDLGAERDLLGAMMLSPRALDVAVAVVRPDDFYKPGHGHIYQAIIDLAAAGEPVDVRTVTDNLTANGFLDQAGGVTALADMIAGVPATGHAGRYARIVRDHSTRRRLIGIAGDIADMGYDAADSVADALDRAEQLLYTLADTGTSEKVAVKLSDAAHQWIDQLDSRHADGPTGTPTGIVDLDEMLGGGVRPSELHFIAARPAMGKTQVGVQIAYHAAAVQGVPSLYVSAEMPTEQIMDRIVAAQGRISTTALRTGRLNDTDWQKVSGVMSQFSGVPLWIYDSPEVTLASIRSQVRRATSEGHRPIGLIVVDYLQLLSSAGRSENRQMEVDTLARGLKLLARSLNVAIIALCQVNRNVESRADKRPMLADLRESGGIEAHGDGVIAIYRDEVYNTDSPHAGTAELIILKQRNGPIGTVQVAYLGTYGIFANMARM